MAHHEEDKMDVEKHPEVQAAHVEHGAVNLEEEDIEHRLTGKTILACIVRALELSSLPC